MSAAGARCASPRTSVEEQDEHRGQLHGGIEPAQGLPAMAATPAAPAQAPASVAPSAVKPAAQSSASAASSGAFLPLVSWGRPVRKARKSDAGSPTAPPASDSGLTCAPEGLAWLNSIQGRYTRALFLGGAGGEGEAALTALLGGAVPLPPSDPESLVLWVYNRLEKLPLTQPSPATVAEVVRPTAPEPEGLILYLPLPASARRPNRNGASPSPSELATQAPLANATRMLTSAALLVSSCIVISEFPAAAASIPTLGAPTRSKLLQLSASLSDLGITLTGQPLQLVLMTAIPPIKFQAICDVKASGTSKGASQQQQLLYARFEQQQLELIPEHLLTSLQRQVDVQAAPLPSADVVAPAGAAASKPAAAAAAAAAAMLKAAVMFNLANVTASGESRGFKLGSASCRHVRGSWLGRLLQVYISRASPRHGSCTLLQCRAEADAFKAIDAVDEALHEYRKRMVDVDMDFAAKHHAEAVSRACRLFMGLVIDVQDVHSIAENFRSLKSRCEEEMHSLSQYMQAQGYTPGHGSRFRAASRANARSLGGAGILKSLPTMTHPASTASSPTSSPFGKAAQEAEGQGHAGPNEVPASSPTRSTTLRSRLQLQPLYSLDPEQLAPFLDATAAAAAGEGAAGEPQHCSAASSEKHGSLIDMTHLSRGTVRAIYSHDANSPLSLSSARSTGADGLLLLSPSGSHIKHLPPSRHSSTNFASFPSSPSGAKLSLSPRSSCPGLPLLPHLQTHTQLEQPGGALQSEPDQQGQHAHGRASGLGPRQAEAAGWRGSEGNGSLAQLLQRQNSGGYGSGGGSGGGGSPMRLAPGSPLSRSRLQPLAAQGGGEEPGAAAAAAAMFGEKLQGLLSGWEPGARRDSEHSEGAGGAQGNSVLARVLARPPQALAKLDRQGSARLRRMVSQV